MMIFEEKRMWPGFILCEWAEYICSVFPTETGGMASHNMANFPDGLATFQMV